MRDFIDAYLDSELENWDFGTNKINIIDHRRLAELLVGVRPERFVLGPVQALDKKINTFLGNLYELSGHEYSMVINRVDQVSGITWWKPLSIKFMKIVKEIFTNKDYQEEN